MNPLSRVRQKIMSTTTNMMCSEPEVLSGPGSILQIPDKLKEGDIQAVMIATTAGTVKRGTLQPLMDKLDAEGIEYSVFDCIEPDPSIDTIDKLAVAYVLGNCQAMIAVGGGSVIDCAKVAGARVVLNHKSVRQMKGILNVRKKTPEFYAVPTTSGTGSEATAAAVVTDTIDGAHYKYSISDPCLIPDFAVLDPQLCVTMPQAITADTGMDALTHAVEAYTNLYASQKVDDNAKEAVKLILENLSAAYEDGSNIEARELMLDASYFAGVAFTNNFVGYVHAVAHALGGLYGIAHGRANAIILPEVLDKYGKAINHKLAELARYAQMVSDKVPDEEAARQFIDLIRKMNSEMGIPGQIEELKSEDFDELIARAIAEANPTYPVPVIWKEADFRELLDKLLV